MDYLKTLNNIYPNIAYFYALFGNISLTFMQFFFKTLMDIISPLQLLFLRAFTLLLFNKIILSKSKQNPYIANPLTFRLVMLRIMCTSGSGAIMHYCIKYLPVSTLTTLYNTSPIFIYFIQAIYYKKPFNKISLTLTIFCFIGVILIVQPSFLFSPETHIHRSSNYEFLSFMMLISSTLVGLGFIFVHDSAKTITTIVNMNYSYLGHICLSSIFANFNQPFIQFNKITLFHVCMFFGVIIFALVAQYLIFASSSLMKPSHTMPFGYASIVVSFIGDVYIFGTSYSLLAILGIFLTSIGLLGKYITEKQTRVNQMQMDLQQRSINSAEESIQRI